MYINVHVSYTKYTWLYPHIYIKANMLHDGTDNCKSIIPIEKEMLFGSDKTSVYCIYIPPKGTYYICSKH